MVNWLRAETLSSSPLYPQLPAYSISSTDVERRSGGKGMLPMASYRMDADGFPSQTLSNFLANMAQSLLNILTQSLHTHKF